MSYALITGSSKGIGREIAIELARRNYNLLLVARSGDLLEELSRIITSDHKVSCHFLAADLTKEEGVNSIMDYIGKHQLKISILVNNAGYGLWGRFDDTDLDAINDLIRINTLLPVNLTYRLLPLLKENSKAYILNIASTTAYQAIPKLAVYASCKTFLVQFSRALHYELKDSGISVTCVSPGTTETNFMDAAGMHSEHIRKKAEKVQMPAGVVARFAVESMFKGKKEAIPGWINKLSVALIPFVPKTMTEKIAAGIYEK